jgi:hypothetical protein
VDERIRRIDLEQRLPHQSRYEERTGDAERIAEEREPAAPSAHCAKPVSTAALRGLINGGPEHAARA